MTSSSRSLQQAVKSAQAERPDRQPPKPALGERALEPKRRRPFPAPQRQEEDDGLVV